MQPNVAQKTVHSGKVSGQTSYANNSLTTQNALMQITPRPEAVMARGAGSYMWDEAGNRYLDFIQGWAVNALGHAPEEISRALSDQSARLLTPSPALHNRPQLELANLLVEISAMCTVHFSNSGAEANEVAIKLARKWGCLHKAGAYEIISTVGAFHGRTLATMAASGKPGWDKLFEPNVSGFTKVAFNDIGAIANAITKNTVAIMVEPIQGEAGVVVPDKEYLVELRNLADEHNLLLILDEIQTGIGRTGHFFAHMHSAIQPDILTLGKGLGGGVPISATLANDRANCFEYGDQGGTYNGNPLMCAVSLAVVKAIAEVGFLKNVQQQSNYLRNGLLALQQRYAVQEVRGMGLLYAMTLKAPVAQKMVDYAFANGLIVNAARPDILRFMPSLRVTEAEIDVFLGILDDAFKNAM